MPVAARSDEVVRDEFMFRRAVAPRVIAGIMIAVAFGLLVVAGPESMFVNPTAAEGVSLLIREMPLMPPPQATVIELQRDGGRRRGLSGLP